MGIHLPAGSIKVLPEAPRNTKATRSSATLAAVCGQSDGRSHLLVLSESRSKAQSTLHIATGTALQSASDVRRSSGPVSPVLQMLASWSRRSHQHCHVEAAYQLEGTGHPCDMPKGRHTASRRRVKAARQFLGWSPAGRAVATSTAL